jgi:GNAT superfamily N-acetyltransferase
MTLSVRLAQPQDASSIAVVHVASWRVGYAGLLPRDFLDSLSIDARTDRWAQILSRPQTGSVATLVAVLDGEIIGFATVGQSRDDDADSGTGELWGLYLHPAHWGAGFGDALHDQAVAELWDFGSTSATLWVLKANRRARAFYEKHGWVADGHAKTEWRGDVSLDEARYRTRLRAGEGAAGGHAATRW